MDNAKIIFELNDEDIICSTLIPEYLSKEEQIKLADKFSNMLILLQTGNLIAQTLHSVIEAGIITQQKSFSDLIVKKIIEASNVISDNKPIVSPSEAFLFKEKE